MQVSWHWCMNVVPAMLRSGGDRSSTVLTLAVMVLAHVCHTLQRFRGVQHSGGAPGCIGKAGGPPPTGTRCGGCSRMLGPAAPRCDDGGVSAARARPGVVCTSRLSTAGRGGSTGPAEGVRDPASCSRPGTPPFLIIIMRGGGI